MTRTLIVGAGFAGLAAGFALRAAGDDDFEIIERAEAPGGTWRDNTYPGVACDVPALLYSLAGRPWAGWSRTYAPGAEINDYLRHVAAELPIRYGTPMLDARWDGDAWVVQTGDEALRVTNLVLACGRLTVPKVPQIAGLGGFDGPVFHSARWDHSLSLAGRRIAVVGTGASGVQLVPALVREGAAVVLFQRTPAWIVPKQDAPAYVSSERDALYVEGEARFASRSGDVDAQRAAQAEARAHLEAHIIDPVLRARLTPDYAFGCKRVLLSDDFYPAVASDAVTLVPSALDRVDGRTLTASNGSSHDVDAVVLATGFATQRQPFAAHVVGESGLSLDEHWTGGMTAVASTLVSGFPNLFVLGGPNATLGHNSSVLLLEAQAAFAADLVGRGTTIRVTPEAEAADADDIARRASTTPWLIGGCDNWYVDQRSGRLTLLWPGTVADFRTRLKAAIPEGAHP
ncbi:MAG: NAD(P)/FAD-dependent oxidoreductase [Microbacterium sp.]